MKRRLSAIEQMIEGNIVFATRLEGSVTPDRLRSALLRVQRKHPALRVVIREEPDGLYYEEDCAPEIPLRIVPRKIEDDCRRECQTERMTAFAGDQPQLRVVWLPSDMTHDLLLTASHRICDGMSMLTIVRDLLRALHTDDELVPYEAVTTRDIIGDYRPRRPWKRKAMAGVVNGLLRLIPPSRRRPDNDEHHLEWRADRSLTESVRQRCKAERVSVHAALLVALDRALRASLGERHVPKWIESPIDARRGRFAALKSDVLFFGGGSLKMRTGQAVDATFWERARAVDEEMRTQIDHELLDMPGRYHFNDMLRPLSNGRLRSIVRLGDALKINGSLNRITLSNLGNVVVAERDAPLQLTDLRMAFHSYNVRLLGLVAYTLNGEMRFHYVWDDKCLEQPRAAAFQRAFMALLEGQCGRCETSLR